MSQLETNLAKLPEHCYGVHITDGAVIVMKRGEQGYWAAKSGYVAELVDMYNARMGVTPAQRKAMEFGSAFGYHVPGADPDEYDSLVKPPLAQAPGEDRDAYLKRIGEDVARLFREGLEQKS